jgi:cobalt-zinc-cadmium resistance protein CzcA
VTRRLSGVFVRFFVRRFNCGFFRRSEPLRTTFTVAENLILGCLIVIFVVVLLLGNWRSGLVNLASVIPLCLYLQNFINEYFGIDANLMGLGAIDFGIMALSCIVEFIAQIKSSPIGPVVS